MPDLRRRNCRRCGRHESEAGPISWQGNCRPCGRGELVSNITELAAHEGPRFHRWRVGMAASVGGVLLDAPHDPGDTDGRRG